MARKKSDRPVTLLHEPGEPTGRERRATPQGQALKARLEAIWADKRVRFPTHVVKWNDSYGYQEGPDLFAAAGKRVDVKEKPKRGRRR